ncbi:LysR family transcriptional regulator [Marinomonas spartinae]|uniref:LysR family transcriptional regulator n=1 Tax=Marinomonas spartinae TaxID=1792290 RepID=UPI0018F208C0|nr:LysR family transcriptional regulator [Marinomonas spartinae]MBJ7556768.1 LysR family transcriptional regulator [Marinomonas spartinae]
MFRSKDIALLHDFVAVCEAGNMTRAAQTLNTTQSAITQRVQRLESALKTKLVKRHSRGIIPTEQGKILLRYAARVNSLIEDAVAEISAWEGSPVGAVSIGLPPSVSSVLISPLISAVKERLPGVELTVAEAFSGYLEGWLQNNEIDFAFLFNQVRNDQLSLTDILYEDLYLISNTALAKDMPRELEIRDLEGIPFVAPSRRHGLRTEVQSEAVRQGVELNVVLEIDAGHQLIKQIELGVGVAVLARSSVMSELESGILVAKPIIKPKFTRTVSLAVMQQKSDSFLLNRVKEVILEVVGELIASEQWLGEKIIHS